jgi:hypothetical protein
MKKKEMKKKEKLMAKTFSTLACVPIIAYSSRIA